MSKNAKVSSKNTAATESSDSKNSNVQQGTVPTMKPNQIDPNNFDISDFNDSDMQKIAYINYINPETNIKSKVLVQTGKIKLVSGGIPSYHEKYYPTDDKREIITIPFDPAQKNAVVLEQMCKLIDDFMTSNEMRIKLFGKKNADNYIYSPLIKVPKEKSEDEDGDDDDNDSKNKNKKQQSKKQSNKPPAPKYPSVTIKLSFVQENDSHVCNMKMIEDKKVVKLNTLQEVADKIRYRSEVDLMIYFLKVWQNKAKITGTDKKLYGIKLQAKAIRYYPIASSGIIANDIEFPDEEDDENVDSPKKPVTKTVTKNSKNADDSDVDTDASDSDASDSDKKGKKLAPAKKTPAKKPVKMDDSESGSDDSDAKKPAKKTPAKKTAKVEDSDSGSDDEQVDVKKSAKKTPAKTPAKKAADPVDSDDDANSDSEDKKPNKKNTKPTSKKIVVNDSDDDNSDSEEVVKAKKKPTKSGSKSK